VINEMSLLDLFVTEVIRLRPPARAVFRRVGPNSVEIGGFHVKADSLVILDFPTRFSTKRFLDRMYIDLKRYSSGVDGDGKAKPALAKQNSLGYGTGVHRCIGAALELISVSCTCADWHQVFSIVPARLLI
jgi:cytochrome P450